MLEVGVTGQNGHSEGGLSYAEQRTHFGLCTLDISDEHCNLALLSWRVTVLHVCPWRCRVYHFESANTII